MEEITKMKMKNLNLQIFENITLFKEIRPVYQEKTPEKVSSQEKLLEEGEITHEKAADLLENIEEALSKYRDLDARLAGEIIIKDKDGEILRAIKFGKAKNKPHVSYMEITERDDNFNLTEWIQFRTEKSFGKYFSIEMYFGKIKDGKLTGKKRMAVVKQNPYKHQKKFTSSKGKLLKDTADLYLEDVKKHLKNTGIEY